MAKKIIVIGSGFAGLSAASFMAKAGWDVTILEKNNTPGGRARQYSENGFTFDMGPSWYWMPDIFERYFQQFGKKVTDYYQLERLDPSYRVYWDDGPMDIPANYEAFEQLFEKIEPGSSKQLQQFLDEAAYKYKVGIHKLVFKPGQSLAEFLDKDLITGLFRLDVFNSIQAHVKKLFKHPKLRQLLEFPVLFLGALPQKTPALYSLMNYADIKGGTWYPQGGMYRIVEAMYQLAVSLGVKFQFNQQVTTIDIKNNKAIGIQTAGQYFQADVIISGADYHHTETVLLPKAAQSYSINYWNKRLMAPSCLLYYVGLNKKLKNILHHSLFFDTSFEIHGHELYIDPQWPTNPLFYVSTTSVTDKTTAPEGCENLFLLIPVSAGLTNDTETLREEYFQLIIKRMEKSLGEPIKDAIIYKKNYGTTNFITDYHSFKGNAYGLANTLLQTAVLKPACRSKKIKNLFYTGQLTVPGPGVPPSLISGEVVAGEVLKHYGS